jgi:hypothetical protein
MTSKTNLVILFTDGLTLVGEVGASECLTTDVTLHAILQDFKKVIKS